MPEASVGMGAGWSCFAAGPGMLSALPSDAMSVPSSDAVVWWQLLAALTSPLLAEAFAPPAVRTALAQGVLATAKIAGAMRHGRLVRTVQQHELAALPDDLEFMLLKGMGTAARFYPDADARGVSDLDLLVSPNDLERVLQHFSARGFRFMPGARRRIGSIAGASMAPLVSPDRLCNVDLHIETDTWPVTKGLNAQEVLGRAQKLKLGERTVLVPAPEDVFLLVISNVSRDKFGPNAVRKLIDAMRIMVCFLDLDWDAISYRARYAHLLRPLLAVLCLLQDLGCALPEGGAAIAGTRAALGLRRKRTYAVVRDGFLRLQFSHRGMWQKQMEEVVLATDALGLIYRSFRRLLGPLRREDGVPRGWAHLRAG